MRDPKLAHILVLFHFEKSVSKVDLSSSVRPDWKFWPEPEPEPDCYDLAGTGTGTGTGLPS